MAASIGNSLSLLSLTNVNDLIGIQDSRDGTHLIVTYRKRQLTVIKIVDQKPVYSRVLRNLQSYHCPVVEDGASGKLVAVVNTSGAKAKQELHVWHPEGSDSVEQYAVQKAVNKLIGVKGHEPLVAYDDGSLGWLFSSEQAAAAPQAGNSTVVTWCESAVMASNEKSVYLAGIVLQKDKSQAVYLAEISSLTSNSCAATFVRLLLPAEVRHAFIDLCIQEENPPTPVVVGGVPLLLCIDELGSVYSLSAKASPATIPIDATLPTDMAVEVTLLFSVTASSRSRLCCSSTAMAALDSSHVATVVANDSDASEGEVTLAIWDTKYGLQCCSLGLSPPLPSTCKLYANSKHVVVAHANSLNAYHYEVTPSTVLGMLGKMYDGDLGRSRSSLFANWTSVDSFDGGKPAIAEDLLRNLASPDKTTTKQSFVACFDALKTLSARSSDDVLSVCCALAPSVVKRFAGSVAGKTKTSFWPHDELLYLTEKFSLPSWSVEELLGACLANKDLHLLCASLASMAVDIPEACLVRAAKFALSEDEAIFKKFANSQRLIQLPPSTGVQEDGLNAVSCPLSVGKAAVINEVIKCPCNDVLMVEHLRSMTSEEALIMLKYLHYVLKQLALPSTGAAVTSSSHQPAAKPSCPTLGQVADWLGFLLDAHYAQLLLSCSSSDEATSCSDILLDLHNAVLGLVRFYDELAGLESLLSQLKDRHALPQKQAKGLYSVEVLHIF